MSNVVIDTNVLLDDISCLDRFENIILPIQVIEELDNLKKDNNIGYKARKAIRVLENNNQIKYVFDKFNVPEGWESSKYDNQIIICAKENNAKLISNDYNVRLKASALGVECEEYVPEQVEVNTGWKSVTLLEQEMADFYSSQRNRYGLLNNECCAHSSVPD